ncbi:hypothetical protein L873DRAFT_1679706 [Choiromyces venosus 120613-1]|uniref:F-box domain-containing protein n=1 Tax=Choiromyces venosus 120613-1 TaxID=1336337 RepID=A0A3N4JWY2_9PEZI|nr:hypothetical protein L873DRAFT_1679706 [Choiromyces venosus 120613-1]
MDSLPIELTDQIISLLPKKSQLSVRLANRRLCELATAFVFRDVTTYFCKQSLERLEHIASTSRLARHVRSFEYVFVGIYSTPMSFMHFKTMLAPPGRTYHGEHMKTFYRHYEEKFSEHKSLLTLEPRVLRRAMCGFPHLRSATLRYGKYDHAYNEESWSYTLKDVPLGGKRAHKALMEALTKREEMESGEEEDEDILPLEKLSVTGIPQMPFDELLSFGCAVGGNGWLVEMLTTVNIHIAQPKRAVYARFPRRMEKENVLLADVVSRLKNVVNLRFWMDDCDTIYCNDAYIPLFPISCAHASLSVLFRESCPPSRTRMLFRYSKPRCTQALKGRNWWRALHLVRSLGTRPGSRGGQLRKALKRVFSTRFRQKEKIRNKYGVACWLWIWVWVFVAPFIILWGVFFFSFLSELWISLMLIVLIISLIAWIEGVF